MSKKEPAVTGGMYDFRRGADSKGKKVLHHIHAEKADNGGFSVSHHFESDGGMPMFHAPETHAFGPEDGGKALAHIGKALGIKAEEKGEKEGPGETSAEETKEEAEEHGGKNAMSK